MSFIHNLTAFDTQLLLSLNDNFSDFWDAVMYVGTDKMYWLPMYLMLFYIIIKNKGRESILIIALLLLTIFFNDQISGIFKSTVGRLRPSHDPSVMFDLHLVNGYKGGLYSFVSSHAANSFGIAIFLSLLIRQVSFTVTIFTWAVFHSYTRIYLGVHFPFDIICGGLLGLAVGYGTFKLYSFLQSRFHFLQAVGHNTNRVSHTKTGFERGSIYLLITTIALAFLFLVIASERLADFMS